MKAAQKTAAAPMRTSARDLDACFFAYRLRSGGRRVRSGAWQVRGGCMSSWYGVCESAGARGAATTAAAGSAAAARAEEPTVSRVLG
eukprot:scaffold29791_cov52-Phaeocystis_antarctica.AAC.3